MQQLLVVAAALALAVLTPTTALAAAPGPAGVDVSYPNGGNLPAGADFAIVGLNGGVGTSTNLSFAVQRAWAVTLPGTAHGTTDLYLNTQNPEPSAASWWPSSDATKRGRIVRSPYGRCAGGATSACSWVYGASLAWDDLETRGVTGSVGRWWLDVEVANSWSASATRNRAVLEGMTSALTSAHQRVGIYSPLNEFPFIIGPVPTSSALSSLPSWIAHAADQATAERLCTAAPLTRGRLLLVQWKDTAANLDHDVACGLLSRAPTPKVAGRHAKGVQLTAKAGTWAPARVSLAYQWTRDGSPIAGAVHSTYTPRAADVHHRVVVTVTGTRTGYSRAVRTSAAHRIAR